MSFLIKYIRKLVLSEKESDNDPDELDTAVGPCCLSVSSERVCLVESAEEWNLAWPYLQEEKVLGFDCEWITKDKTSQPVSLLQLASLSGVVVLVRLHLLQQFPDTLIDVLADKSVFKVGVACLDDGKKLLKDYGLQVMGCVDLRNLALRCRYPHLVGFGLKRLARAVLGVDIDKNPLLRTSNWEAEQLSRQQVEYGAKDAVVGAFIFWRLISVKLRCVEHLCALDSAFWDKASSCCQGLVDLNFKATKKDFSDAKKCKTPGSVHAVEHKQRAYVTRQSPLYHNCQMIAPDGQLLCTCDVKKATWYIEKGLATKVKDQPLIIQLTFEPSGRPMEEKNYYNQDKQNICVVCGKDGSYIRKSVIPREYRKFFPPVMKEHRSHDVLLMCTKCHQESNLHDAGIKQQLSRKCHAPLERDSTSNKNTDLLQVKSAAKALKNDVSKIPAVRVEELKTRIREYFGVTEISGDLLQRAMEIDHKIATPHSMPHGQKVVQYMSAHEGLLEFERIWREHFLTTMKPKYLPHMWSVDHHHDQLSNMEDKMKATVKSVHQKPDGSKLKFLMS